MLVTLNFAQVEETHAEGIQNIHFISWAEEEQRAVCAKTKDWKRQKRAAGMRGNAAPERRTVTRMGMGVSCLVSTLFKTGLPMLHGINGCFLLKLLSWLNTVWVDFHYLKPKVLDQGKHFIPILSLKPLKSDLKKFFLKDTEMYKDVKGKGSWTERWSCIQLDWWQFSIFL